MSSGRFEARLREQLQGLEDNHHRRERRTVFALSTTDCLINGQRCVQFASNDYLGLAHHPDVVQSFAQVAAQQVGSRASALVAGRSEWHERLESALQNFEAAESVVLFPSGFAANLGTLTSLITERDAVFCDHDNHASLVDGCRASAGQMLVYRHRELDRLRTSLARRRGDFDQVFVVTDTVFSMDGVAAPLADLCDIAERSDATLIVDEAHGTGVFGDDGRGVCERDGVESRVAVRIGTLSKAIGGVGGFVAANTVVGDWLWNSARSQFFSTALPPAACAAAVRSLEIIQKDPERRMRLHQRCEQARRLASEFALPGIEGSCGPIVPIVLGDDQRAAEVSRRLLAAGWFVPAIRPPTVAAGTARLRLSVSSEHSPEMIDGVMTSIRQITASI